MFGKQCRCTARLNGVENNEPKERWGAENTNEGLSYS
jgi:hypothetical protein